MFLKPMFLASMFLIPLIIIYHVKFIY